MIKRHGVCKSSMKLDRIIVRDGVLPLLQVSERRVKLEMFERTFER